jgi:hypothetical protein
MMLPALQPRVNSFFDFVAVEPLATNGSFQMQEDMKIIWC